MLSKCFFKIKDEIEVIFEFKCFDVDDVQLVVEFIDW